MLELCLLLMFSTHRTGCHPTAELAWAFADERAVYRRGYTAELVVFEQGRQWNGRLIVTHDGVIYLEHLPEQLAQRIRAALVPPSRTVNGWNSRQNAAPVVRYAAHGSHRVVREIEAPDFHLQVIAVRTCNR